MKQLQELILVPSPGIGHLASMAEIAKLLVSRDDRLSVTVLIMKLPFQTDIAAYIETLFTSATESTEFVDLSKLEGYDSSLEAKPGAFKVPFVESQKPLLRRLLRQKMTPASTHTVAGVVVDMFCAPMIDVADELGVPAYVFYTSGAAFLGLMFHLQALHDERGLDRAELARTDSAAELVVPSFAMAVPVSALPSVVVTEDSWTESLFRCTRRIRETKGIIVNSFMELEFHALRYLTSKGNGFPPVYPVGPVLNLNKGDQSGTRDDVAKLFRWLDDQPPESVVFLCFGSMGSFHEDQVKEIASALDSTGLRFVWSLRRPPPRDGNAVFYASRGDYADPTEVLPAEFLDRTAERGRVIGWAPQASVLAHPSVGGFVSHCGWNSILESLWFGVPTAAWPIHAEQHLNAFQMVKELGLAEEMKLEYKSGFYCAEDRTVVGSREIEMKMKRLMESDSVVRKRVKEMSEKSKKAVMNGGSSYSSLGRLINNVIQNVAS